MVVVSEGRKSGTDRVDRPRRWVVARHCRERERARGSSIHRGRKGEERMKRE